jgi:hypothetical protein
MAGAAFELAKPVGFLPSEVMAQDAEGTRGIAETLGCFLGRNSLDEIGAQSFVLTLSGGSGFQKESLFVSYLKW